MAADYRIRKGEYDKKTCSKCKQTKGTFAFSTDSQQPDGRASRCKDCIGRKKMMSNSFIEHIMSQLTPRDY